MLVIIEVLGQSVLFLINECRFISIFQLTSPSPLSTLRVEVMREGENRSRAISPGDRNEQVTQ